MLERTNVVYRVRYAHVQDIAHKVFIYRICILFCRKMNVFQRLLVCIIRDQVVPKTDGKGELLQEMILVCDSFRRVCFFRIRGFQNQKVQNDQTVAL